MRRRTADHSEGHPETRKLAVAYDGVMRFEVLGPLRAVALVPSRGGVSLGGPKQQVVLALLLAEPNTVVPIDRLVDGVWGEHPPQTSRHTLQSYVSELRKVVGNVVEREGAGYRITVDARTFDAVDLEDRLSAARSASDVNDRIALLESALALWRGEPFAELPECEVLRGEATRLAELRIGAIEGLMRARLDAGMQSELIADLERLSVEHPYREEMRALHMLALYRCGRQAEALRAYEQTRARLIEDLGIDPSPPLRQLQEQILLQDPDLDGSRHHRASVDGASGHLETPYLGLRSFRESDATRFFGQDRLVDTLVERATGYPFTGVVGPSGCGKSSAVHAGLVPSLRREHPGVLIATLKPGAQPFGELAAALREHARTPFFAGVDMSGDCDATIEAMAGRLAAATHRHLLIVIDQFEELYTMVDPAEALRFTGLLARAARDQPRVHVLITLRADFYDRPLTDPNLGHHFADNVINVAALGPEQLEAAAVLPARQLDIAVEPRLIGRLIADVAGQPNSLPLFQYALTELFDERDGAVLDLATYERIGGVRKAVARRAESVFDRLDAVEQAAARQLFLRLATVSDNLVGRRRVPASELVALEVDVVALQSAIDAFARYRLVALDRDAATGRPTVEVAHEALLSEWRRLRDWIDEHRTDLARRAAFIVAVDEWEASDHDPGYLLSGSRLTDYQEWAATTAMRLTATEQDFLSAAIATRDAAIADQHQREELAAQRGRRSRRLAVMLGAVAVILIGVVVTPLVVPSSEPDSIVLALDSADEEDSFNRLLRNGADSVADEFGLQRTLVEPPFTDLRGAIDLALDDEPTLMVGSFVFAGELLEIADDHQNTTFLLLDWARPTGLDNVITVTFAVEEGSFLVGAATAMQTETGKVGYIGANQEPFIEAFRAGFEQGVTAVDADVEIVTDVIDLGDAGYADSRRAQEIATGMYASGVDIIFVAAGGSGVGVIEAAWQMSTEEQERWVVGVDTDVYFDVDVDRRDVVLTSMVKRVDFAIPAAARRHFEGSLPPDSALHLTLADGGVDYSTSGDRLNADTVTALEEFRREIIDGQRTVNPFPGDPVDTHVVEGAAARLAYDGSTCSYDGPRELEAGVVQTIRFSNVSDSDAGAAIWKVPVGTTLAAVDGDGIFEIANPDTDLSVVRFLRPASDGWMSARFERRGDWLIHCFDDNGSYGPVIVAVR